MKASPKPTKQNSLRRLIGKVPFSCVVDVGVNACTSELIQCFREKKHYLFEPVKLYFDTIKKNYADIDYELFSTALAEKNSETYLVLTSLHKNGVVTHSKIATESVAVDGAKIVACEKIEARRFCDLEISQTIAPNFLLKVDVDGQDLNVIKGFGEKLHAASVIIIECTYTTALERMAYIQARGFQLYDIVDLVYYGPSLYQFDLVFIRADLLIPDLRPSIGNFSLEHWSPVKF